ncbi:MAG: nicotinate-nucleotide adenylyltransferase [Candidatus Binatia bacterium]
MKIGVFGGTFDPIHWGHLRSAEEVREAFSLDRVLFIPASIPPLKRKTPGASAADRLALVRLAISGNKDFAVSRIELDRPGKSYSIDTLRHLNRQRPKGAAFYFILGLDAFLQIHRWKDFTAIFPLCHLIVTSRPGDGSSLTLKRMPVEVRKLFCYDPNRNAYRHSSGKVLFFYRLTDIAISASEIRERLRQGKSVRYLLPRQVEEYIDRRHLYRGEKQR